MFEDRAIADGGGANRLVTTGGFRTGWKKKLRGSSLAHRKRRMGGIAGRGRQEGRLARPVVRVKG